MKAVRRTTKRRLLRAASELFAERGFHGTTIRDISERAGVNVASGHYHFGSKKALYLEVLRTHFAEIRELFRRRGAMPTANELERYSVGELEHLLRARIRVMLEILIGPPPGLHGALMQREAIDPSEALPVIVAEFILPMKRDMERIVSRRFPDLEAAEIERCVFSIVGQVLHFRFAMPIVLELLGRRQYALGFAARLAEHITEFSLGGMSRVAARKSGRSARTADAG